MNRRGLICCALACLIGVVAAVAQEASLLEKRKDIIRYGIETELLELVTALQTEKEDALNKELLTVLTESRSPKLQEALLKFFAAREWKGAIGAAVDILDRRDEEAQPSVQSALGYLATVKAKEGLSEASEILNDQETKYLSAAVRLLGRAGGEAETEILLKIFESDEATDSLKQDTIRALGEIRAPAAVDKLIAILDDTGSGKATRMYAAEALGKIADPRAVAVLVRAANGDDPQVRANSVTALGAFTGAEAESALVQALRDGVPGVRIAAIKGSADLRIREAEPYIRYRARNDPERKVKDQALQALGEFGGKENLDFLQGLLKDKKVDAGSRATAFSVLLEKDTDGSRKELEAALALEAAGKDTSLLKAFQRALIQTERKGAAPLVEAYLLKSPDFGARIAGIDWVRRNKVLSLKPLVAALAETDTVESVKKRAASALADL